MNICIHNNTILFVKVPHFLIILVIETVTTKTEALDEAETIISSYTIILSDYMSSQNIR
jgi:TM2 domain-containing membrane protein YozV